jgi:hypothetical protein
MTKEKFGVKNFAMFCEGEAGQQRPPSALAERKNRQNRRFTYFLVFRRSGPIGVIVNARPERFQSLGTSAGTASTLSKMSRNGLKSSGSPAPTAIQHASNATCHEWIGLRDRLVACLYHLVYLVASHNRKGRGRGLVLRGEPRIKEAARFVVRGVIPGVILVKFVSNGRFGVVLRRSFTN